MFYFISDLVGVSICQWKFSFHEDLYFVSHGRSILTSPIYPTILVSKVPTKPKNQRCYCSFFSKEIPSPTMHHRYDKCTWNTFKQVIKKYKVDFMVHLLEKHHSKQPNWKLTCDLLEYNWLFNYFGYHTSCGIKHLM